MNMQSLPCVSDDALYKTIFWVCHLLGYHIDLISCLPGDLNECAEASLHQWQMPLQDHLLNKHIILTWWAVSLGRPEQWMCRSFPDVTDLKIYLLEDLIKHADASYISDETPLQDHIWESPLYWLTDLCLLGELNNGHTEISPVSMTLSSISWETWMNVHRLPCVSHEYPLQDHLPSKPIVLTQEHCLQETWTINMKSHPQCQGWISFLRPSFEYNDHINSLKLCLKGPKQSVCRVSYP